jgi:hypothetical protein
MIQTVSMNMNENDPAGHPEVSVSAALGAEQLPGWEPLLGTDVRFLLVKDESAITRLSNILPHGRVYHAGATAVQIVLVSCCSSDFQAAICFSPMI